MKQKSLLEKLAKFETAILADALENEAVTGAIDVPLRPLIPGKRLAGVAITLAVVAPPKGEEPSLAQLPAAVEEARGREAPVLVIHTEVPGSPWGGCIGQNAKSAGVRGVVVDGAVRDTGELLELGEQVFFRHKTPSSIKWRGYATGLMSPVTVGGVTVRAGDFVFGDDDGVVVVPVEKAEAVLTHARVIAEREVKALALLKKGFTFAQVLALRAAERPDGSQGKGNS